MIFQNCLNKRSIVEISTLFLDVAALMVHSVKFIHSGYIFCSLIIL